MTPEDTKSPAGSTTWFWQWYKTFGASMMQDKQNKLTTQAKEAYENILYSQLTKGGAAGAENNNTISSNYNMPSLPSMPVQEPSKPEDLSHQNGQEYKDYKDYNLRDVSPIPSVERSRSRRLDVDDVEDKMENDLARLVSFNNKI